MIRLKQIKPAYRKPIVVLVFLLVFKLALTLFYDSYYYFYNTLAPKWDHLLQAKFGLEFYFLKLKPYLDPSFFISSFKNPVSYLGVLVFIYLCYHRKKLSWKTLGVDWALKLFFILPGLLLCWEMLSYDYNFYLNQYFLLERVLMVVFLVLVWKHPMYAVWFLITALLFRAQYDFPLGRFPLFDKKVLFDIYILLISFLLLRTKLKLSKKWLLFFLVVLIGSNYFTAGLGKLMVSAHGYEWPFQNPVDYLILNMKELGWSPPVFFADLVSKYKVVFQCLSLSLELAAITIFYKRKWAILLLSGFVVLHIAILYLGGTFFWKWMVIDLLMLVYLIFSKTAKTLFTMRFFKLSFLMIPFAILWSNAIPLGWFDTKYNQVFDYKVVLNDGKEYNVSKDLFNPYQKLFYRNKFLYLVNQKRINISGFGYTFKYGLAQAINKSDIGSLDGIKQKYGINAYNEERDDEYTKFIKTFFQNYNQRLQEKPLRFFEAPKHFYNDTPNPVYKGQGKIKIVKVYLKETYIEDGEVEVLQKKLIKRIEI